MQAPIKRHFPVSGIPATSTGFPPRPLMFQPAPLSPELRAEIDALADALEPIRRRRPRARTEPYADRRLALLAAHLGRTPAGAPEPITCVGDSHTLFFSGADRMRFLRYRRQGWLRSRWINRGLDLLPIFRSFHLGPCTAWKAADFGSTTRGREKLAILLRKDLRPGDRVLLSFGEIDCRSHLPRRVQQGAKLAAVARETAERFVRLPRELRRRGLRPLVWAPAQISASEENLDADIPVVGPWEMRRDLTYAFTECLRELCRPDDIPVVGLAGLYHPPRERPAGCCFHDGLHLSQSMMPLALRELDKAGFLPQI